MQDLSPLQRCAKGSCCQQILLLELAPGEQGIVVGVQDHSPKFLQYLDQMKLVLGVRIKVLEQFEYDESIKIQIKKGKQLTLSKKVSQNLFVQRLGS